jgi:hypothetical protein
MVRTDSGPKRSSRSDTASRSSIDTRQGSGVPQRVEQLSGEHRLGTNVGRHERGGPGIRDQLIEDQSAAASPGTATRTPYWPSVTT